MQLDLSSLSILDAQNYLQHAIAPRPIAFASTVDAEGNPNLSPFSFFNLFSSNPPILIFSPARRGRDNTIKHTLENVQAVPEVVINIVDFPMVQQMSLSSTEYEKGVNEFAKAGFTEEKATKVKPPMVKESKIKLECKVIDIQALGQEGGAGNLIFAEVLVMHIDDNILDADNNIDQQKIEHVARLGGNWYCKVDKSNLFEVEKPLREIGMGIDALPLLIRDSKYLSGNNLGQLGNKKEMPELNPGFANADLKRINEYYSLQPAELETETIKLAAKLLNEGNVDEGWQVLLTII